MLEKLKEIIADQLNVDADSITAESRFKEDLEADSLDLFELVMALEEEYGVEIPSEDLEKILTVQDVIDYMKNMTNTQFFQVESGPQISAKDILEIVYKALSEKGYNPVNQIVGYIMSGDPTYITSHNGARSLIMKMERDELVEEMLKTYIEHNEWE